MSFENAIVLTGGIASGKSSAGALLSMLGFRIIDADSIAHKILQEQAPKIAEYFGQEYLDEQNRVNRRALGGLIFSDSIAKKRLESLLHPLIRQEIKAQSQKQEQFKKPYIIDIPLFFETGEYPIKKVIVIYTPRSTQLERLIKREGLSKEEAEARLNAQIDIEEKRKRATWVIDNSGDLKQLQRECERVQKEIVEAFT